MSETDSAPSQLSSNDNFGKDAGCLDIGKAISPLLDKFKEMEEKSKAFREWLKPQFESAPYEECPFHENVHPDKDWNETFTASYKEQKFIIKYEPCPECVASERKQKSNSKWLNMGIPARTCDATFDNYEVYAGEKQEKMLRRAKAFADRCKGFLVVTGTTGTGKGHLVSAVMKRIGSGLFVTQSQLLAELRETYGKGGSAQSEFYRRYQTASFLVVDEIGLSVGGQDEAPMLYEILAYRYDRTLPTALVSNLDSEKIKDIVGDRLSDRIAQDYVSITATWESYRRRNKAAGS